MMKTQLKCKIQTTLDQEKSIPMLVLKRRQKILAFVFILFFFIFCEQWSKMVKDKWIHGGDTASVRKPIGIRGDSIWRPPLKIVHLHIFHD